jgi:type II secretory pathway component PulM
MNKKTLIAGVVIIVLLLAYWMMQKPAVAPAADQNDLSAEVTGLGDVNLDAEMQAIDSEIEKL